MGLICSSGSGVSLGGLGKGAFGRTFAPGVRGHFALVVGAPGFGAGFGAGLELRAGLVHLLEKLRAPRDLRRQPPKALSLPKGFCGS